MPIDLYYHPGSPPCRSVLLTAKAVGVDLNLKKVDLLAKEQLKPEFVAINFQHTLPTMVDGNITLWESRAICCYLASQYGKDDSLYPNNPRARCVVDARLYFDMGTLSKRWSDYMQPLMKREKRDPAKMEPVHEALGWLNTFLMEYNFAAGNKVTVADHCLVSSVTSLEASGIDIEKYTRITRWLKRCKTAMPGYQEANGEGLELMTKVLQQMAKEIEKPEEA